MLNSRKLFRALALPGLLAMASVGAHAQTCTLFTTNFALRPEGLTELIGDLTVTCTSALPANFSVLVQLPNGVNFHTTGLPAITPTGGTFGPPAPVTTYAPAGLPNTVSISVTNNVASTGFTVTGLRINANAASAAGIVNVPALVIISSGATIINLTNNPSLVATILPKSLSFTVVGGSNPNASPLPGAPNLPQCVSNNVVTGFFKFSESFSAVLRNTAQEGLNATQGTRLRVVLSGIPANVTVLVPNGSFTTGNNILTAITGVGATVSGVPTGAYTGFTGAGATPGGDPVYTGGYGPASTEMLFDVQTLNAVPGSDSTATVDVLHIPFVVRYTGGPSVGLGTATARGGLGTVGGTGIVRFADVTDQSNMFTIVACSTTLLYPFVTTAAGFDTGIAIANTTADPAAFGTPNQTGQCTITPYGSYTSGATPPAAGTTPAIPAGRVFAASLQDSGIFAGGAALGPGFTGYLIAQCNFQLAHGYAFVSTYGLAGANSVAQGYLALVLMQNAGSRTFGANIEQLNN